MVRKPLLTLIVLFVLFIGLPKDVFAIANPLDSPNNKYGIHISNESELDTAATLVNSFGGDFGYVTLVVTEAERDRDKFQKVLDKMRSLHLIPIIRIATKSLNNGSWEKPKKEEINNWIAFLNSLNWVVKNRYIIIYNEPNHAKEWGGDIDPREYTSTLKEFSKKLKEANKDFFVLPAGFDSSAPNSNETMDEEDFLKKMVEAEPDVFNFIDGWVSHSYPNPNFSGSEKDKGRGSINTFDWEISILKNLNVNKDLPIFITETGWKHNTGNSKLTYMDPMDIGEKLTFAFENVWNDKRIVAVTPFILNYKNPPFENFSWIKPDGSFYEFFETIRKARKAQGKPEQISKGAILAVFASPINRGGSVFSGAILIKNFGQSIWENSDITVSESNSNISILGSSFYGPLEPFGYSIVNFRAMIPINSGFYRVKFAINYKGVKIGNEFPYEIISISTDKMQNESLFARIGQYLVDLLTKLGP